jgi:iron(III) transport system permease protein
VVSAATAPDNHAAPDSVRRGLAFARLAAICGGTCNWTAASAAIAALALLPVAALAAIALGGPADMWHHLAANVLPATVPVTLMLLTGVALVVVLVGAGTAWLVAAYDFPARHILDWALLLPLAVPTYVVAFAYLDMLHPLGPVQGALRALLGIADPRDFRLPDIRSLPGAILLFGLVLYPYVYLTTRALFLMQAAGIMDAARILGAGGIDLLRRVALPLARPAIAVGVSLALMETLNDVGASEFLGIRTLTLSVYAIWVNQSNLPGAAGLALAMLAIVVTLVVIERLARRARRFAATSQRSHPPPRRQLAGGAAWLAFAAAAVPVALGFLLPSAHLAIAAARRVAFAGIAPDILPTILNTLAVSAIATLAAIACGLVVAFAARMSGGRIATALARVATLGYALPGTVLAIGLLFPLAAFDNVLNDAARAHFGIATGLLITGSGAAVVIAYVVRFLAISTGSITAGFDKVPRSLDESARVLGRRAGGVLAAVHLPLLRPALAAAAILVFVDCMKELPATLLLRPLNFETLATLLYGEAVRGTYEDGALAALAIVAAGLLPVVLLARIGRSPIGASSTP